MNPSRKFLRIRVSRIETVVLHYLLMLHQINSEFTRTFRYRLQPDAAFCFIDTTSNPPSVTPAIMVDLYEFTDTAFNGSISWLPPEISYGNIDGYDVVVSESPLEPNETTIPEESFIKMVNTNYSNTCSVFGVCFRM